MKVGFTGTQRGMTDFQKVHVNEYLTAAFEAEQRRALHFELGRVRAPEFHHGDCIGADVEAADIARGLGYRIVSHPPEDERRRAFDPADEILEPLPFLVRNRAIVNVVDFMIATPANFKNIPRGSGTWQAIRYAAAIGRPCERIYPSSDQEWPLRSTIFQ